MALQATKETVPVVRGTVPVGCAFARKRPSGPFQLQTRSRFCSEWPFLSSRLQEIGLPAPSSCKRAATRQNKSRPGDGSRGQSPIPDAGTEHRSATGQKGRIRLSPSPMSSYELLPAVSYSPVGPHENGTCTCTLYRDANDQRGMNPQYCKFISGLLSWLPRHPYIKKEHVLSQGTMLLFDDSRPNSRPINLQMQN